MPTIGANAFKTNVRESSVEGDCRDIAEDYGFQLKKITGHTGDTDRMLTGKRIAPCVYFIEFKKPGLKKSGLSPAQKENIKALKKRGYSVLVIDNKAAFKEMIIDLYENGYTHHE